MWRRKIIILLLFSAPAYSRVATSSLFPSIRSINPAAVSDRGFSGYNVQASKKDIEATLNT